jgi:predicted alpha/beta hydrolase
MRPHRAASALRVPVHLVERERRPDLRTAGAVDALAEQFRNAAVQRHTVHPHEVGVRRLGHFGAFRREPGPRLWQRLLHNIEQATPALRP